MIALICFSKSAVHRIHCVSRPLGMINTTTKVIKSNQENGNIKHCYSHAGGKHLPTALSFSHFILILKYHWHLLWQFFYSTITSTLVHRQYKFIFGRPKRKPLRYLTGALLRLNCDMLFLRNIQRWMLIQKLQNMNKMPNHFSWKVNIWSLPPVFSLKSSVLLKSYTTLSGFPFTKGKDYGGILLAASLNSRGQSVHMQLQICKNNHTTNPPTNSF